MSGILSRACSSIIDSVDQETRETSVEKSIDLVEDKTYSLIIYPVDHEKEEINCKKLIKGKIITNYSFSSIIRILCKNLDI